MQRAERLIRRRDTAEAMDRRSEAASLVAVAKGREIPEPPVAGSAHFVAGGSRSGHGVAGSATGAGGERGGRRRLKAADVAVRAGTAMMTAAAKAESGG